MFGVKLAHVSQKSFVCIEEYVMRTLVAFEACASQLCHVSSYLVILQTNWMCEGRAAFCTDVPHKLFTHSLGSLRI